MKTAKVELWSPAWTKAAGSPNPTESQCHTGAPLPSASSMRNPGCCVWLLGKKWTKHFMIWLTGQHDTVPSLVPYVSKNVLSVSQMSPDICLHITSTYMAAALYLPSPSFFQLQCTNWEPHESMSCLFISCISSANRSPILQEGSAVQAQYKTIIIVTIFSYCSLQMFHSSGTSVRLTPFLSSVAYFICAILHWVMAVPLAILQEYPPYLPRAETNG